MKGYPVYITVAMDEKGRTETPVTLVDLPPEVEETLCAPRGATAHVPCHVVELGHCACFVRLDRGRWLERSWWS